MTKPSLYPDLTEFLGERRKGSDMEPEKQKVDDLVAFFHQWPELRAKVNDLLQSPALQEDERTLLRSMIHVIDCVGPADLQPPFRTPPGP